MKITDGLHIDRNTYVPAAGDAADLTQRQGESYKVWQARLGEVAKEMTEKFPLGKGQLAHTAVEKTLKEDPTEYRIPGSD